MANRIRIIPHQPADDRPSVYFYFDDNPGRRSITNRLTQAEAESAAKELARTEQEKLDTKKAAN